MVQTWMPIKNFSKYEISNDGNVRVVKSGMLMKQNIRGKNCKYMQVVLVSDDKVKTHKNIHRLVAETFISNPFNKPCVNHKDGNKLNNHMDNLEWVTRSENDIHAFRLGLRKVPSERMTKAIDATRVPVRNKTTGETFRSITEAALAIDGKLSGVRKCITGERKRYKGMEFEVAREVVR